MMRFLNVYPKRLIATLSADGAFEGQIVFDLEAQPHTHGPGGYRKVHYMIRSDGP